MPVSKGIPVNITTIPFRKVFTYAVPAALFSLGLYLFAHPASQVFGRVIHHLKREKKDIALTFDDGPNGRATLDVLRILQREGVKATFFVIGRNVEKFPLIAREIVAQGHMIGNHSHTHPWSLPFLDSRTLLGEVLRAESVISRATGVTTTLFRPPHGFRTPWMLAALKKAGYRAVTWDTMSFDYLNNVPARFISRHIVARAEAGSIIVLHDGLDLNHGVERKNTIEALAVIIRELRSRGFNFVTLEGLPHGAAGWGFPAGRGE